MGSHGFLKMWTLNQMLHINPDGIVFVSVFTNFKKAFDSAPKKMSLVKLPVHVYGTRGEYFNWFKCIIIFTRHISKVIFLN